MHLNPLSGYEIKTPYNRFSDLFFNFPNFDRCPILEESFQLFKNFLLFVIVFTILGHVKDDFSPES